MYSTSPEHKQRLPRCPKLMTCTLWKNPIGFQFIPCLMHESASALLTITANVILPEISLRERTKRFSFSTSSSKSTNSRFFWGKDVLLRSVQVFQLLSDAATFGLRSWSLDSKLHTCDGLAKDTANACCFDSFLKSRSTASSPAIMHASRFEQNLSPG